VILEQCYRQRLPLPDALQNAPELHFGLELYFISFLELSTCRALGPGGEGGVSWLAISDYADRNKFSEEQREDLFFYMHEMDKAYLAHQAKALKASVK
jgi:hypothetical protein